MLSCTTGCRTLRGGGGGLTPAFEGGCTPATTLSEGPNHFCLPPIAHQPFCNRLQRN